DAFDREAPEESAELVAGGDHESEPLLHVQPLLGGQLSRSPPQTLDVPDSAIESLAQPRRLLQPVEGHKRLDVAGGQGDEHGIDELTRILTYVGACLGGR